MTVSKRVQDDAAIRGWEEVVPRGWWGRAIDNRLPAHEIQRHECRERFRRSSVPVRVRASQWSRASQEAESMGGRGASSGGSSNAGYMAAAGAVAVGGYVIGTAANAGGASGSSGDHSGEDEEEE